MGKTTILWGILLLSGLVAGCSGSSTNSDGTGKAGTHSAGGGDSAVSGTLSSKGSDTMNNLMTLWSEGFKKQYPNVSPEIEGKGSATAPVALTQGTAIFGPMSREMKPEEIDKFKDKFGYEPTCLPTSLDMLAIYVHKDNPIAEKGLTLEQVDAIFSKTRKTGASKDIQSWGDLGVEGDGAKEPIRLYGRNAASGTYVYLKEHVLKNGDYKDTVKEQPGSSAVVQSVGEDRFAIGYSGIGYKTANVKAVPLLNPKTKKLVEARPENKNTYPLSRFLYLCLNYKPRSQLDPLRREFIKFVFSKEGQLIVDKDGYLPLTAEEVEEALGKVGLGKK